MSAYEGQIRCLLPSIALVLELGAASKRLDAHLRSKHRKTGAKKQLRISMSGAQPYRVRDFATVLALGACVLLIRTILMIRGTDDD